MVSIASYMLSEFVFIGITTYVLLFCVWGLFFARVAHEGGSKKLAVFVGLGGLGMLLIAYVLPIRVGTMMFINGVLFTMFVLEAQKWRRLLGWF